MRYKNIIITGTAGFVGKKIVNHFLQNNSEIKIIGIDISDSPIDNPRYSHKIIDLSNNTIQTINDADAIIHLAGQPSVWNAEKNPSNDFQSNVLTMLNILFSMTTVQIPILYLSTIALYKDSDKDLREDLPVAPDNWYGMSKYTAENYCEFFCEKNNVPYAILRAGFLYDKDVARGPVADIKTKGNLYKFNSPETELDFIHLEDLYLGIWAVLEQQFYKCGIFNIASGRAVKIQEIGNRCNETPPETHDSRKKRRMIMDITKFSNAYNWKPTHNVLDEIEEYL